jgi:hypothetical protein
MKSLWLLAAAALLAGCALDPQAATVDSSEKVYRTGSNIPKNRGTSDVRVLPPGDLESLKSNRSANTGRGPGN